MRYLIHHGKQLVRCALLLLFSTAASSAELSLGIDDIESPAFHARGISLVLPMDGSADLHISKLNLRQREFLNVRLHCGGFALSSLEVACRNGRSAALADATIDFSYGFDSKLLRLSLVATTGESWQVTGQLGEHDWKIAAQLHNAQLKRLSAFLPTEMPHPTKGLLNGTVKLGGNAAGINAVQAELRLADAAFSDASGLHAADKLRGNVSFATARRRADWKWHTNIGWQSGELYWQPLYLTGDQTLSASGSFDGKRLYIEQSALDLPDVGRVLATGSWDFQQNRLIDGRLHGVGLGLSTLFETYAKPFLEKGTLAESTLYGQADADMDYRDEKLQALHLNLRRAGIADAERRYVLLGVNSDIDWRSDRFSTATIAFDGGALLGAPLGAGQWTVNMKGLEFDVPEAVLPVLDGKLELRDFHLHRQALKAGKPCQDCPPQWHWYFAGSLQPISMAQLSSYAGWPKMLGTLSGRIPRVSYDGQQIDVDGALQFNVFDGTVTATQLKLADAFGRGPRLSGNLAMRNLDLDLLTRTFSFGNMQGRLDGDVEHFELEDWQPVRFDARVYSSPGNYPKKISQKAVQNISSLGGAGAAAAIERSFLGIFQNFGYDRIGWRCALANDVCAMGGIEDSNSGPYSIIRGGGIPAISVIGYNRTVSWGELVTRLKRVTQSNVTPIVQ